LARKGGSNTPKNVTFGYCVQELLKEVCIHVELNSMILYMALPIRIILAAPISLKSYNGDVFYVYGAIFEHDEL